MSDVIVLGLHPPGLDQLGASDVSQLSRDQSLQKAAVEVFFEHATSQ
jgi:hypothetical protein